MHNPLSFPVSYGLPTIILSSFLLGLSPPPAVTGPQNVVPKIDELSADLRLEIENRLKKNAPCLPNCATLEQLRIELTDNKVFLNLRYHVISSSSIPLPISSEGISPEVVEINNVPLNLVKGSDGRVYAHLFKGIHDVKITAALPAMDLFTINLPMLPKYAEVLAHNFQVLGMNDDGKIQNNIQFVKKSELSENKTTQQLITPLIRVTRDVYIGLEGKITTTIDRLSPLGSPIVAEIPLLTGEEVISQGVRIQNRKAQVSIDPKESKITWSSRLNIEKSLELNAQTEGVVEIWRIKVTPLWHLEVEEATALRLKRSQGNGFDPVFKPWPGQKVLLKFTQPDPIDAPSFTIESSKLSVTPGARNRDIKLNINANASRGLKHSIDVPPEWTIVKSTINNELKPLSRIGRSIALPFLPGKTAVEINFREEIEFPLLYKTPSINFNSPSVNFEYKVVVPNSRWLLWTKTSGWGPVVLFWSQIVVAFIVAGIFYMSKLTPLGFLSWLFLTIGLTQSSHLEMTIPGIVLCLIGIRRHFPADRPWIFNLFQIFIGLTILMSLLVIYEAISRGLLGVPNMYVQGNDSNGSVLNWYQDKMESKLPDLYFISVSMAFYRGMMLLWSLWLAMAMIRWASWIWTSMNTEGIWKKSIKVDLKPKDSEPSIPPP